MRLTLRLFRALLWLSLATSSTPLAASSLSSMLCPEGTECLRSTAQSNIFSKPPGEKIIQNGFNLARTNQAFSDSVQETYKFFCSSIYEGTCPFLTVVAGATNIEGCTVALMQHPFRHLVVYAARNVDVGNLLPCFSLVALDYEFGVEGPRGMGECNLPSTDRALTITEKLRENAREVLDPDNVQATQLLEGMDIFISRHRRKCQDWSEFSQLLCSAGSPCDTNIERPNLNPKLHPETWWRFKMSEPFIPDTDNQDHVASLYKFYCSSSDRNCEFKPTIGVYENFEQCEIAVGQVEGDENKIYYLFAGKNVDPSLFFDCMAKLQISHQTSPFDLQFNGQCALDKGESYLSIFRPLLDKARAAVSKERKDSRLFQDTMARLISTIEKKCN